MVDIQTLSGPIITPWVAYTPTITAFGTPSGVSVFSRRVGDSLEIMGKFTSGTSTAAEARLNMGFNGVDGAVTSSTAKVPSIRMCGGGTYSVAYASSPLTLIESAVTYITFGLQDGTAGGGLAKRNGNVFASSGTTVSFTALVPIEGW